MAAATGAWFAQPRRKCVAIMGDGSFGMCAGELETLARLNAEKNLLSRDITAVDMRLPDRLTVRLSDALAQAREDALKKPAKKKGGDA